MSCKTLDQMTFNDFDNSANDIVIEYYENESKKLSNSQKIMIDEKSFFTHKYFYSSSLPIHSLQMCEGEMYQFSRMDRGCSSQLIIENISVNKNKADSNKSTFNKIYTNIY